MAVTSKYCGFPALLFHRLTRDSLRKTPVDYTSKIKQEIAAFFRAIDYEEYKFLNNFIQRFYLFFVVN